MTTLKTPKYHRQRFLLMLLDKAGGRLSKMDLQKLLFLSNQEAGFDYYDFVPYHFGCYSFQAQSDLTLLGKLGWLTETAKSVSLQQHPVNLMPAPRQADLATWLGTLNSVRGKKLLRYVYTQHPYYAIKSHIAADVLDQNALSQVQCEQDLLSRSTHTLFTLGYEGLSFEAYINKLIVRDIQLLCDVRKNPLSRKFGFSKNTLSVVLPKLGIAYVHIPELGIHSELRQGLDSAADYQQLFKAYRKQLPGQIQSLTRIESLVAKHHRVALTCFEKEHQSCHRHCVSDYLKKERNIEVCHL